MKRFRKFLLWITAALLTAVFSACSGSQEALYSAALARSEPPAAESPDPCGLAGHLTVWANGVKEIGIRETYDFWFQQFQQEHPGVTYELDGPETILDQTMYTEQTTVRLMSGEGGDLLDLLCLPYFRYAKSGLLEDLTPYLEGDPTFDQADYYENIFRLFEYGDGMYALPCTFSFPAVRLNQRVLSELGTELGETVSPKEILEWYGKAREQGMAGEEFLLFSDLGPTAFDGVELTGYLDEGRNTADFLSPDFQDYLEAVNSAAFPKTYGYGGYGTDKESISRDAMCVLVGPRYLGTGPSSSAEAWQAARGSGEVSPLLQLRSGRDTFPCQPALTLAVTSASRQKDLAWEFLKFIVEEKDYTDSRWQNELDSNYHVNRANTGQLLERGTQDIVDGQTLRDTAEQCCSRLNTLDLGYLNFSLAEAIQEIAAQYYAGLMSAEECTGRIQERVSLYLGE